MELADVPYARRDPTLAVLENFHAIKHAVRFGAHLLGAWTADPAELDALSASLAPDVRIPAEIVDAVALKAVTPRGQVIAVARRPRQADPATLLTGTGTGPAPLAGPGPAPRTAAAPLVLLENPAHLGNLGAVIRVCAAAGAAGVLTTGRHDPWHADALRGSAGLHFAVPVHRVGLADVLADRTGTARPLIALDPEGDILDPAAISPGAILAFGTERHGISDTLLAAADRRIRLPMEPGVSSLNLATAVAATLYALRLAGPAAQRA
ncbi:MAG TPA: TrmH family RNA methyltransferase [Solirubrobacteraceae bacterium]|nr:TrmH family RNA methyltransferase [Solirubrobacteraceae bacterium]